LGATPPDHIMVFVEMDLPSFSSTLLAVAPFLLYPKRRALLQL
jgi:hypothetical protein